MDIYNKDALLRVRTGGRETGRKEKGEKGWEKGEKGWEKGDQRRK